MNCLETCRKLVDLCQMEEDMNMEISRLGIANILVFLSSIFIYFILSLLSRSKHVYSKLPKMMEIMRSVLAGLTISLLFKEKQVKNIHLNFFKDVDRFMPCNSAIIMLSVIGLITILSTYVYRRFSHDFSSDEMKSPPSEETTNSRGVNLFFFLILKDVKYFTKPLKEKFNEYYAPIVYLFLIFFHAIFAGIGFDGRQYIGLCEIIVMIHKIYEIFHLKRIMDKLCTKKEKFLWFGFVMFFNTSFGILFRRFLMKDASLDQVIVSKMCRNMFFKSFIFMFFVESLFPFPKSFAVMVTNLFITLFSYTVFNNYL